MPDLALVYAIGALVTYARVGWYEPILWHEPYYADITSAVICAALWPLWWPLSEPAGRLVWHPLWNWWHRKELGHA